MTRKTRHTLPLRPCRERPPCRSAELATPQTAFPTVGIRRAVSRTVKELNQALQPAPILATTAVAV